MFYEAIKKYIYPDHKSVSQTGKDVLALENQFM